MQNLALELWRLQVLKSTFLYRELIRNILVSDRELRMGNLTLELWRLQGLKSTLLQRQLIYKEKVGFR